MIDELDQKIIQAIQNNGREPNVNLAKRFGVGEGTIRRRITDLVSSGIIKIKAVPNPIKLGCSFIGMMGIEVKVGDMDYVAEKLAKNHQVYYLGLATGRFDIILIFLCHDSEELAEFVRREIAPVSSIIRTETFVNMTTVKSPWSDQLDVAKFLNYVAMDQKRNEKP